jgi:hypothetical protein
MAEVVKYSILTGIWKSIKNVAIVMGIPALVLLLNNWTQIVPTEWNNIGAPIVALISYFVKNYIENKN